MDNVHGLLLEKEDRIYIPLDYFSSLAFRMKFFTPTELSRQILAALMHSYKALQLAESKPVSSVGWLSLWKGNWTPTLQHSVKSSCWKLLKLSEQSHYTAYYHISLLRRKIKLYITGLLWYLLEENICIQVTLNEDWWSRDFGFSAI